MRRRQAPAQGGLLAPLPTNTVGERPFSPRKPVPEGFNFSSGSPCRAKGGKQPLRFNKDARANIEHDIMAQLQKDVKFSVLDKWDADRSARSIFCSTWDASKALTARGPASSGFREPLPMDFSIRPTTEQSAVRRRPFAPDMDAWQMQPAGWQFSQSSTSDPMRPATVPSAPRRSTEAKYGSGNFMGNPPPEQAPFRTGNLQPVVLDTIANEETLRATDLPEADLFAASGHTSPKADSAQDQAHTKEDLQESNDGPRMRVDAGEAGVVIESAAPFASEGGPQSLEALTRFLMTAESDALEQTISPHYVLIGAEKEILEGALAIARVEAQKQVMLIGTGSKSGTRTGGSIKLQMTGHGDALLSFVPLTIRRCIRSHLVFLDQWKVLLESPVNSWYDPVLSRFPAAVVFADASGFTKLTESLARQPQGAEKIGHTLNGFFGPLINIVSKHGGDIIKFSGDALTIIWAAAEPALNEDCARSGPRRRSRVGTQDFKPNVYDCESDVVSIAGSAISSVSSGKEDAQSTTGSQTSGRTGRRPSLLPPTEGPLRKEKKRRRSATEQFCKDKDEVRDMAKIASVASAASFCLEVQREIHKFGRTPVPGCQLTMHIGVGFGELALLQLGGLMGRWEYCIAGKALDQISIAEPLAGSGETVFSPEARQLAERGMPGRPAFEFEEIDPSKLPKGASVGYAKLLEEVTLDVQQPELVREPEGLAWWIEDKSKQDALDMRLVKRYVPSAVALRLACAPEAESVTYPEEMRRISVVFLAIDGLDPFSSEPRPEHHGLSGGRETQLLMRLMQRSVYALEGSVNKFLVDDKGILLLVCFGLPPLIHFTDDPVRAVLCAMRLRDTLKDEGLQGRVGVATGQCWCGVVGTEVRREYTVLGDTVNLAARLMGKAGTNQVLVDMQTKNIAAPVLDFDDGEVFRLKGKVEPVRAFRFLRPRKGLKRNRKEAQVPLMKWSRWPAQINLVKALEANSHRSGVMIISGPGGSGKTELAEGVRNWAAAKGWTLLAGQNMDPSGTFVLPRLSLQEAFQELVKTASRDSFWRQKAWQLLTSSLGQDQASPRREHCHRPPANAELYWMLVGMLRSSVGEEAAAELEPWMPLLSLVVTQLAFAPRMVSAMVERDEQHAKNNRFAELCTGIIDAFSRFGSSNRGSVLLLHLRRSSAFFQSRDGHEAKAIQALAEACMKRRREAMLEGEERPVLLCVVAWDGTKDSGLRSHAEDCFACIESEDLDLVTTRSYVEHLIRLRAHGDDSHNHDWETLPEARRKSKEDVGKVIRRLSAKCAVPLVNLNDDAPMEKLSDDEEDDNDSDVFKDEAPSEILAGYLYEMTGGNLLAIKKFFEELVHRQIIFPDDTNPALYRLDPQCTHIDWIKKTLPVPESLVGMAFSNFERLDPKEQVVLKAASTFDGTFSVRELSAALPKLDHSDLCAICERLASKEARAIRLATAREAGRSRANSCLSSLCSEAEDDEERFQFYSGLLRHAASTLVLEAQRSEVRRNSRMVLSRMTFSKLSQKGPPQHRSASSSSIGSMTSLGRRTLGLDAEFDHGPEAIQEDDGSDSQEEDQTRRNSCE